MLTALSLVLICFLLALLLLFVHRRAVHDDDDQLGSFIDVRVFSFSLYYSLCLHEYTRARERVCVCVRCFILI